MTRKKRRPPKGIDVRAILESPVGKLANGRQICPYEASMRRAADEAAAGKMRPASRFLRALISYGLIEIPKVVDDHQYIPRVPKDWDAKEWQAMFQRYGPPPWAGEHDGLVPTERWKEHYGPRPKLRRSARSRKP